MKVSFVNMSFVTDTSTTETLLGSAEDFGDAHAMIITHIEAERAKLKAAWYEHFKSEWPGEHYEIELVQTIVGDVAVVTYAADTCWYQITK